MTLLDYLNQHRKTLGLPDMHSLPTLDGVRDLPKYATNALNPIHVLLGLSLKPVVREWSLSPAQDGDNIVIELRYMTKALDYVVEELPESVWVEICTRWPNAAVATMFGRQSVQTAWGLDEGSPRERRPRQALTSRPSPVVDPLRALA